MCFFLTVAPCETEDLVSNLQAFSIWANFDYCAGCAITKALRMLYLRVRGRSAPLGRCSYSWFMPKSKGAGGTREKKGDIKRKSTDQQPTIILVEIQRRGSSPFDTNADLVTLRLDSRDIRNTQRLLDTDHDDGFVCCHRVTC